MHRTDQRQRAVTLIELTTSVAVMSILIGGLGSAVVLASRAMPDPDSLATAVTEGYYVTEQIAGELLCAQSFTVRTATTVEFTVADRDPPVNPGPETIRYEWSGTPGDPLMRDYNGTGAVEVLGNVNSFDLTYGIKTQSETTTEEGTTWTNETMLASFNGWTGVTGTTSSHLLGPGALDSEYFEIIAPDGVTEMKITRAEVFASNNGTPPNGIQLSIRRSLGDGSYLPAATPIGTPALVPGADIEAMGAWHAATFSDVLVSDLARQDYCLVVEVPVIPPAYVHFYYSKSAPDDGMYHRWTENGGASWEPRSNQINQQDLRFSVHGKFSTTGTLEITVDRYFLTSVRVAVRAASDPSAKVETSVPVLNAPEVATP